MKNNNENKSTKVMMARRHIPFAFFTKNLIEQARPKQGTNLKMVSPLVYIPNSMVGGSGLPLLRQSVCRIKIAFPFAARAQLPKSKTKEKEIKKTRWFHCYSFSLSLFVSFVAIYFAIWIYTDRANIATAQPRTQHRMHSVVCWRKRECILPLLLCFICSASCICSN